MMLRATYHKGIFSAREASCADSEKIARPRQPEIGLLNYHPSPHSAIGVSPAVALMGRQIATQLPVVTCDRKIVATSTPRWTSETPINVPKRRTSDGTIGDTVYANYRCAKWRTSVAEIGWGEAVVDPEHCVQK